jgi:hypothetical protein
MTEQLFKEELTRIGLKGEAHYYYWPDGKIDIAYSLKQNEKLEYQIWQRNVKQFDEALKNIRSFERRLEA